MLVKLSVRCVLLVLVLSTAVNHAVCETFTIVPTPESLCPEMETCYTLDEYASNSNVSSGLDKITLEFCPGTHILNISLVVRDLSWFAMTGENATLQCVKKFNVSYTGNVTFRGMLFVNCGGRSSIFEDHINVVTNLILEDLVFQTEQPFFIDSATNTQIINSTFTRSSAPGVLVISGSNNGLLIRNCTFSDNVQTGPNSLSTFGLITAIGGQSSVTIESSVFKNNHMQTTGVLHGRGNRLTIVNSTFQSNSGGRLGAGAITSDYQSVTISSSGFSGNYAEHSPGAVALTGRDVVAVITNRTVFFNNTSTMGSIDGGALDVSVKYSSITIEDTIFHFNNGTSGGAIRFNLDSHSSVLLSDCYFSRNTGNSRANGGAVDVLASNNASLIVNHSRFINNKVASLQSGGAMNLRGDLRTVVINESSFENNNAHEGGAISTFYFEQNNDSLFVIANSRFISNTAISCGGINVDVSTFEQHQRLHSRTVQVTSSVFSSNHQDFSLSSSGGMCLSYTNTTIANSNFSENSGGALSATQSIVVVNESIFNNNFAAEDGGAVYGYNEFIGTFRQTVFTNNKAGESGGAVYLRDSQATFYDSTFGSNVAKKMGGAIAINEGGMLEIDESNNVFGNVAQFGSVISACDGAEVNVNVSTNLFVGQISGGRCVLYSTDPRYNNAVSVVKKSLIPLSVFILSIITIFL